MNSCATLACGSRQRTETRPCAMRPVYLAAPCDRITPFAVGPAPHCAQPYIWGHIVGCNFTSPPPLFLRWGGADARLDQRLVAQALAQNRHQGAQPVPLPRLLNCAKQLRVMQAARKPVDELQRVFRAGVPHWPPQ